MEALFFMPTSELAPLPFCGRIQKFLRVRGLQTLLPLCACAGDGLAFARPFDQVVFRGAHDEQQSEAPMNLAGGLVKNVKRTMSVE